MESNGNKYQEGRWKCTYCNVTDIRGRRRSCPSCGAARDEGVKFYLLPNEPYITDAELLAQADGGPDWICGSCNSCNDDGRLSCQSCGAERSGKTLKVKEYEYGKAPSSAEQTEPEPKKISDYASTHSHSDDHSSGFEFPKKLLLYAAGLAGIFLVATLIFALFKTHLVEVNVTGFSWERTIEIDELRTVREDDWNVPAGGRQISSRREIHHYDKVIDHYDNKTRTVTERVQTGTTTEKYACGTKDKGNGFFETKYCERSVPVYKTETRQEPYKDPVYKDEPRYQTKYTYDIDRWVHDRTERASGSDRHPEWPTFALRGKQREAGRDETYTTYFTDAKGKAYFYNVDQSQWTNLDPNKTYKLRVNALGIILGIEEADVEK